MTMWRPTELAEQDVSDLPGIKSQRKRRRSRRRAWRDGLADQTVVQDLEHVRAYRTFERTLIGSVDSRSVNELELVHGLARAITKGSNGRDDPPSSGGFAMRPRETSVGEAGA